jgi:hypothetical protein
MLYPSASRGAMRCHIRCVSGDAVEQQDRRSIAAASSVDRRRRRREVELLEPVEQSGHRVQDRFCVALDPRLVDGTVVLAVYLE